MAEDGEESQPRRACRSLGNEPTGSCVDPLPDNSPGLPPVQPLAQPQIRSSQRLMACL